MHDEITISATDKLVSDPDFDTLRRKLERKCNHIILIIIILLYDFQAKKDN